MRDTPALRQANSVYEKIFDPRTHAYYYYNTLTFETTWQVGQASKQQDPLMLNLPSLLPYDKVDVLVAGLLRPQSMYQPSVEPSSYVLSGLQHHLVFESVLRLSVQRDLCTMATRHE